MNVLAIAAKEIREGLRNRWIVATTLLLGVLALTLSFLGSAPTGKVGASALDVMVVSLSSLTIFLIPLIALLLSHDAIVGEAERGTLLLLLSYPVSRGQIMLGKFLGPPRHPRHRHHRRLRRGRAGAGRSSRGGLGEGWAAFARMIVDSIMLGAVFLAIGYAVSALAPERGVAAGIAVGLWLLFALVYDMVLLGALVVDQGRSSRRGCSKPPAAQPCRRLPAAQPHRRRPMRASSRARPVSPPTRALRPRSSLAALAGWIVVPLALASALFSRREL